MRTLKRIRTIENGLMIRMHLHHVGGESLTELETRVVAALKQLPNEAVVVTHGGPIRVILTKFSPEEKEFWSWDIPHGTGYRLEWESDKAFKEGKHARLYRRCP